MTKKESLVTLPIRLTCINIIKLFSSITSALYFKVLVRRDTFQPSQELMSEAGATFYLIAPLTVPKLKSQRQTL